MKIGERLKTARKDKRLTQQQVADALGVAKSTYSGYESGFRKPDVLTVQKLAAILEVSGGYLIGAEAPTDDAVEFLYVSHPSGDESVDDLRKQLHDYIDSLDEDELRAMSVMFRIQR